MATRRGRFEPQGTRGDRRATKSVSQRRNLKREDLATPLRYQEGKRDLQHVQEVRDKLVDYVDEELKRLWEQLRGGKSQMVDSDFRLPQSLDVYGRVDKLYTGEQFLSGRHVDTALEAQTGTVYWATPPAVRAVGGSSNIFDFPTVLLRDAQTDWVRASVLNPKWVQESSTFATTVFTIYDLWNSATAAERIEYGLEVNGTSVELGNTVIHTLSAGTYLASATGFRLRKCVWTFSAADYSSYDVLNFYLERRAAGAVDNFAGTVHFVGAKMEVSN